MLGHEARINGTQMAHREGAAMACLEKDGD